MKLYKTNILLNANKRHLNRILVLSAVRSDPFAHHFCPATGRRVLLETKQWENPLRSLFFLLSQMLCWQEVSRTAAQWADLCKPEEKKHKAEWFYELWMAKRAVVGEISDPISIRGKKQTWWTNWVMLNLKKTGGTLEFYLVNKMDSFCFTGAVNQQRRSSIVWNASILSRCHWKF